MNKLRESQSGFTLIELVSALAITGIIFTAATIILSVFFQKYDELTAYSQLQSQAYDCVQNTLKYGIPVKTGTIDLTQREFFGIANADSVIFTGGSPTSGSANGVILYPPRSDIQHVHDYVKYYLQDGFVRCYYQIGRTHPLAPLYVFPENTRHNKITVTGLSFTKVNRDASIQVVKVRLKAKVLIGKRNYKYVDYTTQMAIRVATSPTSNLNEP